MSGFNPAIQLHQLALMNWADCALGLKTPHNEPNDQKGSAIPVVQTNMRHGPVQKSLSQNQGNSIQERLHAQNNLPSQYVSTSVRCTNDQSSNELTKFFPEQQTTAEFDFKSSLGRKRKAPDVIGQKPDRKRTPESEPPTKKYAGSRHIPLPQPGVPYQIMCGKAGYVPAIVLFPGCSEGPFSVENTELLCVEACCRYDRQSNTLSCSKTTEICHPVQYLDIENPAHREVQWVEAASLKPLAQDAVLSLHYERMLAYLETYGHRTSSHMTAPQDTAQRMAIARFVWSRCSVSDGENGKIV